MRVFLILVVLFSSVSISQNYSWAQDEIDEEFFEEDEPMVDPLEEPIGAPPSWEGDPESEGPRPQILPRPSGGFGSGPSSGGFSGASGDVQFRLVDPPAFKKPKKPVQVPNRIRKKVEDKVRQSGS